MVALGRACYVSIPDFLVMGSLCLYVEDENKIIVISKMKKNYEFMLIRCHMYGYSDFGVEVL